MVYQRVSKPYSGNSQIRKKKRFSLDHPTIPVQAQSVSASPQEQEMPSYTPLAANWVTNNNLMRSMSGAQVVQRQNEELQMKSMVQQSGNNVVQCDLLDEPIPSDVETRLDKPIEPLSKADSSTPPNTELISDDVQQLINDSLLQDEAKAIINKLQEITKEYKGYTDKDAPEKYTMCKNKLVQVLGEEKRVRKDLKKELDNLIMQHGDKEAREKIRGAKERIQIIDTLYRQLSGSRIEAKINVLGDDRKTTSKKESAKYKNLLKLDNDYRKGEAKRARSEGAELDKFDKPVHYLTPEQREQFKIKAIKKGEKTIYVDHEGNPVDSSKATQSQSSTGAKPGVYIFTMDENGQLYVADEGFWSDELSNSKFHHSSFLAGKPVASAGEIIFSDGKVTAITDASGHYRPDLVQSFQILSELKDQGMNINDATIELSCAVNWKGILNNQQEWFDTAEITRVKMAVKDFMDFITSKGPKAKKLDLLDWLQETKTACELAQ